MQREDIKTLFTDMQPKTVVSVAFHAPFKALDGQYSFVEAKKGRGRGGSLGVVLSSVTDGATLEYMTVNGEPKAFGTPVADYIQTITVGSKVIGDASTEAPAKPKSANSKENSKMLRETFLKLAELRGDSIRVEFTSDDPSLEGVWTPAKVAVKHPGRFGQVSLTFTKTNNDGTKTSMELWSYKDVDRINMIDLLPAKQVL
jgi:hypothetical protein